MNIEFNKHTVNGSNYVELLSDDVIINSEQDILDLIVDVEYQFDCKNIIVHRNNLNESFFELKSGFAGNILLKLSNYKINFGIIGDFSDLGNTFHDFIFEANKNGQTVFTSNIDEAIALLKPNQ